MQKLTLILFSVIISVSLYSQDIDSIFRVRGEKYFGFVLTSEMRPDDFTNMFSIDGAKGDTIIANASLEQFKKFLELGIPCFFLSHPSEQIDFDAVNIHHLNQHTNWNFYPDYDSYMEIMSDFSVNYPEICQIHEIGTLVSGRKLLAARISKNIGSESDKPRFLYTSTIHGDELTGYVLSLQLIDYLLTNYGTDPYISRLVDSIDIWINPLANPDGTFHFGNNTINGAKRYNAQNIDLNRNYPDPKAGAHPDNKPWQEETVFFMEFAENQKFNMSANWHGGAEVCNYPWDTWYELSADNPWWVYTMREFADTVISRSPSPYFRSFDDGIVRGSMWYSITGGRQDYMNYFQGCREFTLELSNNKIPPPNNLPLYWEYNYPSFLNYIEQSLYGVRGIVRDSVSGEPLRAKVFITNHDIDSSFVYSHLPAGDYHRYLYEGSYNIVFSAPGHNSKTFYNVNVGKRRTTWLNVELSPAEDGIGTENSSLNIRIYPNPVTDGGLFISSNQNPGFIELINSAGIRVFYDYSEETEICIYTSELASGIYLIRIHNDRGYITKKIIVF